MRSIASHLERKLAALLRSQEEHSCRLTYRFYRSAWSRRRLRLRQLEPVQPKVHETNSHTTSHNRKGSAGETIRGP